LLYVCNNFPIVLKAKIEYNTILAKAKVVFFYNGNNIALGTACGRSHRCSTLAIIDDEDLEILNEWFLFYFLFQKH